MSAELCCIDGCDNELRSRQMCITHYEAWRAATSTTSCSMPDCLEPVKAREMCRLHYERWYREVGRFEPRRSSWQERFWAKVDKTGECWLWTGHLDDKGYGKATVRELGSTHRVHRIAYELLVGPIPRAGDSGREQPAHGRRTDVQKRRRRTRSQRAGGMTEGPP